jgi:hypothetical protein
MTQVEEAFFKVTTDIRHHSFGTIYRVYDFSLLFSKLESDENALASLMKTINFGKNLRLSQIQPIKTAEIRSIQFGIKKEKTLHPVCISKRFFTV